MKCAGCKKTLTDKMETEYSKEYTEAYCGFSCAQDVLFDKARCTPKTLKEIKALLN